MSTYAPAHRARLWIANLLDNLFPRRYCWALLVSWALYHDEDDTIRAAREQAPECRSAGACGACYCGKFMDPALRARRESPQVVEPGESLPF